LISDHRLLFHTTMSRLNPGAYSFVPGQRFTAPTQQQPPPPPPLERPEQTEAPRPAPTISLNIGGAKPTPVAPPPPQAAPPADQVPPVKKADEPPKNVAAKVVKPDSSAPSKTFSTEKAKTDTSVIAQEVKAVADKAVLDDLYGHSAYFYYYEHVTY